VQGEYDGKEGGGFSPGGASLHSCLSGHGPDAQTHEKASNAELKPIKVGDGSMAFMFESSLMMGVSDWAYRSSGKLQAAYSQDSWGGLKSNFKRPLQAS
jgi:homogentisate 1,2-dioxygenase